MKHQIDNILRYPEPQQRRCRVIKPLAPGRYQVIDDLGRTYDAAAAGAWRAGDRVILSRGRIVSADPAGGKPLKVYEV